jgi:hypothetical protein
MPNRREIDAPERGEVKPSKGEIRARVEYESERRARLGVPAFAGGVLYLLGSIVLTATLKGLPTVGPPQGIAPALDGQPNPAVSPRAAEMRFYDHHAFGLIAGALVSAIALLMLLVVLRFMLGATRFRRPETAPIVGPLILVGGIGLPLLTVVGEIVQAVNAHSFVTGHDFTTHAVEQALTRNTVYVILGYVTPLAALALVGGMVALMVSSVRVGLQVRWMGIVGGVGAVILLFSSQTLSLIPVFWMVGTGMLLMGRWPNGDPPAWASGEARPWPSQAQVRAERDVERSGSATKGASARSGSSTKGDGGDANGVVVPEPVMPGDPPAGQPAGAKRRRRKRGSRS